MLVSEETKIPQRSQRSPDPVDIHVGSRLRLRRNMVGMSQEQLGRASGLTFQQIQKYERGANRMGASRIFQFCRILEVPVSYFFEELPGVASPLTGLAEGTQAPLDGTPHAITVRKLTAEEEMLQRRETLELMRAYYRITDQKQRRKIYELIKTLADEV